MHGRRRGRLAPSGPFTSAGSASGRRVRVARWPSACWPWWRSARGCVVACVFADACATSVDASQHRRHPRRRPGLRRPRVVRTPAAPDAASRCDGARGHAGHVGVCAVAVLLADACVVADGSLCLPRRRTRAVLAAQQRGPAGARSRHAAAGPALGRLPDDGWWASGTWATSPGMRPMDHAFDRFVGLLYSHDYKAPVRADAGEAGAVGRRAAPRRGTGSGDADGDLHAGSRGVHPRERGRTASVLPLSRALDAARAAGGLAEVARHDVESVWRRDGGTGRLGRPGPGGAGGGGCRRQHARHLHQRQRPVERDA